MEILIREAEWNDIYLIHRLIQEAFQDLQVYYPDGNVPALSEKPQEIGADLRQKRIFTAWAGEELVGTVRYAFTVSGEAYISRFATSPDYQKSGIGKKLLHTVHSEVENRQGLALTLHANLNIQPVIDFYLHHDFQIRETTYEKGYPRAYLVKPIGKGSVGYETLGRQVCLQNG